MRCDIATVLEAFGELQRAGFKRPQIPRSIDDLAAAYLKVLSDLPAAAVTEGVTRFLREGESRFWPKPAELRKQCLSARREVATVTRTGLAAQYHDWEARGWRNAENQPCPCPVCEAVIEPKGRITVHHDLQRHREQGIPPLRYA